MKQNKPTTTHPARATRKEVEQPSNTRREDWIDKLQLMEMFKISARTVDYYVEKGVLNCTCFGGRRYFYLPGIMRSFEVNYR